MRSTIPSFQLSITGILRHGTEVHTDQTVATATADGYRETSYADLGARIAQLAHGLARIGVTPGQRVATFMWNNQEHLEAYFAIPCMGAVLHTLNVRLAPEQISWIANHAGDSVVIADLSLAPLLSPVIPHMNTVHTVVAVGDGDLEPLRRSGKTVLRYEALLDGHHTEFDWPAIDENDAAAMCYTSGTTGAPKGVVYSHRSVYLHSMAVCTANAVGLTAGDRALAIVPMFHASAWGLPHAALMSGSNLVLPDRHMGAERLVQIICEREVTIAAAVPTILNDLLHHLDNLGSCEVPSLRMLPCGGSAVPDALMRSFQERYGVSVRQMWGMTETSPLAAAAWPPLRTPDSEGWRLRNTAGRLVCGVEGRIVGDDGQVLPRDGESVGEITLTDRAKDLIKSGGEWISSVELENHIMAHPAVLEACVVAVPDPRWQERPFATIVVNPGDEVTAAQLRRFLTERDNTVRWHLPERWAFIDQVPRTGVGKFDKKLIRSRYADGAYDVITCHD